MKYRVISLVLVVVSMLVLRNYDELWSTNIASPLFVLGFMLIASFCAGCILEKMGLPRITGYIIAGLIIGPYITGFADFRDVEDLGFLNSLALAFIAFSAGAELKWKNFLNRLKPILYLISGVTIIVFSGVTILVFLISDFFPFMKELPFLSKIAISSIFGVIAVARSPSSTIAVISETKAKGEYTDTVLSVSIATDVVIIVLFAIVISIGEVLMKGGEGSAVDLALILHLVLELTIAFTLGFILGKLIVFLLQTVQLEFPVVIVTVGFIVIKSCHLLSSYMKSEHDISLNLEPLLICMAAGFTVQNFSKLGESFLEKMDSVSYPIYVAFFTITGAGINIEVLKKGWMLGVLIFAVRGFMMWISSYISGYAAGDKPLIYKNTWLGFLTQAGVSLGLLAEVVRRFPEVGIPVQSILIATITLNQIIGPVTLKLGLKKAGDIKINKT